MKLENLNPAKRNTNFTVNGNTYWIGHGGFVDDGNGNPVDVPEKDSAKLMQGKAWKSLGWDPQDPRNSKRMMPAPTGTGIGRRARTMDELNWDQGVRPKTPQELGGQIVTVPTKDGIPTGEELPEKPLTDADIQKSHEATEAEVSAANKKSLEQDTGLLSDVGEALSGTETTQQIETATADSGEPADEVEWPDPTMEMKAAYLREMAEAYEVKHNRFTAKKDLISGIMAKMYPEGE